MHYVFKSKADADLIMMSGAGDQLLRIVGKEPAPKGIIELAAIPAAMRAIELAIAAEDEAARHAKNPSDDDDSTVSVRVGLHQRAWPMLEMMKRSIAERSDIVWGV
jgi:hypothetical protein